MLSLVCVFSFVVLLDGGIHPYDVIECEPELVSGYYIELGGVLFIVCYLSEGIAFMYNEYTFILRVRSCVRTVHQQQHSLVQCNASPINSNACSIEKQRVATNNKIHVLQQYMRLL